MPDLRLYRLAFIPVLAALVVLSFSLSGVPAPVDPPPATVEFDSESAAQTSRSIVRLGDSRTAGSQADSAAAGLVKERFENVAAGSVSEESVDASADGEDVTLRNVILTLPGRSDSALLIVAARDSRSGVGAETSAAATATLLELTDSLAVSDRSRTLVLASTSGGSLEGEGARELEEALPEQVSVDAAIVISQPGAGTLMKPHLVTSGPGSPSIGLSETVGALLEERADVTIDRPGALAQIARLALPAAAGEQAALEESGLDAVAVSSAGEVPLESVAQSPNPETLQRFGSTLLAVIAALDATADAPAHGPGTYVRIGDNLVPGWGISLLTLALLVPPLALSASLLARGRREGDEPGRGLSWVGEWALPAVAVAIGLFALGVSGVIPGAGVPYVPASFELGLPELLVIVFLAAIGVALWWILGLRRLPAGTSARSLGAMAGVGAIAACLLALLANPALGLILAPLAHVVVALALTGRRPAGAAPAALAIAAIPALLTVAYVAGVLDWGADTPWQLVVLASGGTVSPIAVLAALLAGSFVAAVVRCALATASASSPPRRSRPVPGGSPPGTH